MIFADHDKHHETLLIKSLFRPLCELIFKPRKSNITLNIVSSHDDKASVNVLSCRYVD
ncbi:MAG: hypothetical protein WCG25_03980 [bacterium]